MQCLDRLDAVTKVRYEKKLSISNLPGYPYMYTTTIVARPGSNCFSRQNSLGNSLGSDNSGSNPLYFTFCNKLSDMSSADNIAKTLQTANSFDPDQVRRSVRT